MGIKSHSCSQLEDTPLRFCIVAAHRHEGCNPGKLWAIHVFITDDVEALDHVCLRNQGLDKLTTAGKVRGSKTSRPGTAKGVGRIDNQLPFTNAQLRNDLASGHKRGSKDNRVCSEVASDDEWGFVNVNLRPYYAEGSKTLGYEVAEQLGWRLPAQVVVPIASGSLMTKIDKAFTEFIKLGVVEASPYKIFGAQATGCSPVATAWKAGVDVVKPQKPNTIAKSLAIGNPADGPYAIDVANRTGGAIEDVTDDEVVAGIRLLAETEGIFGETAGGVTIASLQKLLVKGLIDPNADTVVLNTGDGLKTLDAVSGVVGPTATIPASLEQFRAAVKEAGLS